MNSDVRRTPTNLNLHALQTLYKLFNLGLDRRGTYD